MRSTWVHTAVLAAVLAFGGSGSSNLARAVPWDVYSDPVSDSVCGVVNATNLEVVVLSDTGELVVVTEEDYLLDYAAFVDEKGVFFYDGIPVGQISFADDGDGFRTLWLLAPDNTVLELDPLTGEPIFTNLLPFDFLDVPCDACELWDHPADCVGSDCPVGQVIFSDSFDAGASTLWGNERGAWFASNGVYDASMPTNNPLTFTSLPYVLTDLCVQMDIRAVSDGGVWLHADSGGNDGVLLVTGGFDHTGRGLYWHIVRNGQWGAVLGEADDLFNQGDDIHLRVTVEGAVYRAYLNHSTVPASTITTDAFPSGRVGLYDYTSPA
ncbi:MAG: hypothetical protein V1790_16640 [Planctomycetota bacterium]